MFTPERIDHHGWQLALLALSVASIADPEQGARRDRCSASRRALSLAIGLEMIIYLALAGGAMVLFWVDEVDERERLRAYAVSLGERRRSASWFLLPTTIGARCAMPCRRCGCRTR